MLLRTDNYILINGNNVEWLSGARDNINLIYADMMYDEFDFSWINLCRDLLADDGSIFVQTDYRSVAELKIYMDSLFGKENFVNWIIWPYDWGGRSRNRFARKHDDILWYSKTRTYKFYGERVSIPKITASGVGFNPSGRDTKIPTDVWSDIGNFHTMSLERIKDNDGKNIHWQKPLRLMDRIILATTDEGDCVVDPFMGTGSTGVSALNLGRFFLGIELDEEIFEVARKRIEDIAWIQS